MATLTKQQAADALLSRRTARKSLAAWNELIGNKPAAHHRLLNAKLQSVAESSSPRYVIILMPPGAAKSTYASKAFPPWFLGFRPGASILACSYSHTLAANFGRSARDLVDLHEKELGYSLRRDTRASDEWETTNGGRYFCAGLGAGIAGHRADIGLIDDYLGSREDADSKVVRNKQFNWFNSDFYPRLKPNASIIIVATRWNSDDLVGRLLDPERKDNLLSPDQWEVIRLPFFAKANDPLGRMEGERLWAEWFTPQQAAAISRLPAVIRSSTYQQDPAPEEGDFFKRSWFVPYEPQELPNLSDLRVLCASDHAVSKRESANKSAFGTFGLDSSGDIWWLPTGLFWQRADTMEQCREMLRVNRTLKPVFWIAEKGHITQSLMPFLRGMMRKEQNRINFLEYTPKKDKQTRARSFQGLASTGRFHVPMFAPWWEDVEFQLLNFPNSAEDDVVDMLAHLGNYVEGITKPDVSDEEVVENFNVEHTELTFSNLKRKARRQELALADN